MLHDVLVLEHTAAETLVEQSVGARENVHAVSAEEGKERKSR